jgi:drug/metabolite transporter (DMT)-like permease
MKRLVGIILVQAITVLAIVDCIHDFISSDGIHYFSEEPHRLLFVAVIGIAGGLAMFAFSALSPRFQRGVKLVLLGSCASFVTVAGGYFTCLFFRLAHSPPLYPALPWHLVGFVVLGAVGIASLLWFEFYQVLRSRDSVA